MNIKPNFTLSADQEPATGAPTRRKRRGIRSSAVLGGAAGGMLLLLVLAALGAPFIATHNPYDLATIELADALLPPAWLAGGTPTYWLGTDDQGRDLLSLILFGVRSSLWIGVAAALAALVLGVAIGLICGWYGGFVDVALMRIADIQLSFPTILVALLIDGIARGLLGAQRHDDYAPAILVAAICLSQWVKFARTVRGSTLVERRKEYVQAAILIGLPGRLILWRHILPNVMTAVLVVATLNIALAIMAEATLSFLGVGLPPTEPSLGTLIRTGNDFLFSGEWWLTVFPGGVLAFLVVTINLFGDWARDAFDPRLH